MLMSVQDHLDGESSGSLKGICEGIPSFLWPGKLSVILRRQSRALFKDTQ